METVGIDMLDILIKEGPGWNISKEFLEGVKVAKEIMEAEGYYNLTDWDAMSYKDQIREVMTYCSNVSIQEGKKKDQVKEETSFDWNCFSEKDFARLQREQNAEIYGCDGSDNDVNKKIDHEALPENVQAFLYKLL